MKDNNNEYKTCDKCCYDILDDEGDVMDHECIIVRVVGYCLHASDNEMIAEFMGWTPCDSNDNTMYANPQDKSDVWSTDEMRFYESWDWLMPVVQKIKDSSGQGIFMMEIGLPIDHVYKRVVEFIKENERLNMEYESFNEAPYGQEDEQ